MNVFGILFSTVKSLFAFGPPISTGTKAASSSIKEAQKSVDTINKKVTIDDVNKAKLATPPAQRFAFAVEPRATSIFSYRAIPGVLGGKVHFHGAIDFAAWMKFGSPVKSPEDGVVILNKADETGCTFVAIKGDVSQGFHYLVHVGTKDGKPSTLVSVGSKVKAGQVVGFTNNTGAVTGSHVHHAYFTPAWVPVDVVRCFYKRFAPALYSQITYYEDKGQLAPKNKTGKCCGEWGD